MTAVESILRQRIGLDSASLGTTLVERIVRRRMKHLGLERSEEYRRLLTISHAEWTELMESVLITETWFFRDPGPFEFVAGLMEAKRMRGSHGAPLRILSVPCSSGEEPYSLAMALLASDAEPGRFRIDAADISGRSLVRAEQALYGRNSFRGRDLLFRDRFFQRRGEDYLLSPDVRRCVRFRQGNLLAEDFFSEAEPYDAVFCRNLLIYFDRTTQRRALKKVSALLAPGGYLFVGPAEQPLVAGAGFVPLGLPMTYACRKPGGDGTPEIPAPIFPAVHLPRPHRGVAAPENLNARKPGWPEPPPGPARNRPQGSPAEPRGAELLDHARRLADWGRLKEAQALCGEHLRHCRDSAHAYYLLGVIGDALGEASAADCYRRALYLDPNHYETLVRMALLAEGEGDAARARTLKRRAQRARGGEF